MEIAIRVVVVLLVAVTVGMSILFFAKDILKNARDNLDQSFADKKPEQKILRVNTVTVRQLAGLVGECAKLYANSIADKDCFAVFSQNALPIVPTCTAGQTNCLPRTVEGLNVTNQAVPNSKAFFISYDALKNEIVVASS